MWSHLFIIEDSNCVSADGYFIQINFAFMLLTYSLQYNCFLVMFISKTNLILKILQNAMLAIESNAFVLCKHFLNDQMLLIVWGVSLHWFLQNLK